MENIASGPPVKFRELMNWIIERHRIYVKKTGRFPKPWTNDPIMQQYRFCNVYRELDKETMWIAQNWRDPHKDDDDVWFAMAVARVINWSPTLQEIGYPVPWNPVKYMDVMRQRTARGDKVWGGAYIVSTNGVTMQKAEYIMDYVLNPLWEARGTLRPWPKDTLEKFYQRITKFRGMGSFMAGQVIADTKYTTKLARASDWFTWAASGPGSRRGLNRVWGRRVDAPWTEPHWREKLAELHDMVTMEVDKEAGILNPIHAQDLQNCLCEFDKYERVRLGEGRPRSTYPGVK